MVLFIQEGIVLKGFKVFCPLELRLQGPGYTHPAGYRRVCGGQAAFHATSTLRHMMTTCGSRCQLGLQAEATLHSLKPTVTLIFAAIDN